MRVFLLKINRELCVAASTEYEKICNAFRDIMKLPDDDRILLELLGLYRNTVHNNGVHVAPHGDPKKKEIVRVHKGVVHVFKEREKVILDWPRLMTLTAHLRDMWEHVARSEKVRAEKFIPDDAPPVTP